MLLTLKKNCFTGMNSGTQDAITEVKTKMVKPNFFEASHTSKCSYSSTLFRKNGTFLLIASQALVTTVYLSISCAMFSCTMKCQIRI